MDMPQSNAGSIKALTIDQKLVTELTDTLDRAQARMLSLVHDKRTLAGLVHDREHIIQQLMARVTQLSQTIEEMKLENQRQQQVEASPQQAAAGSRMQRTTSTTTAPLPPLLQAQVMICQTYTTPTPPPLLPLLLPTTFVQIKRS